LLSRCLPRRTRRRSTRGETVVDTAFTKEGAGAWTSASITDTVAEIGTTGMYEISLTAAEMNFDWIAIKFSVAGSADQMVLIKTYAVDIDDVVRATTPANTLDVSAAGEAGALLCRRLRGRSPSLSCSRA